MARKLDSLKRLNEQKAELLNKISKLETQERIEKCKVLVGKCFKFRNSYSCPSNPSDYWWLYAVVTGFTKHGFLQLLKFQIDKDGRVRIDTDQVMMHDSLAGYAEITSSELAGAWLAFGKHISKIGNEIERHL
jgi:hypothetical protein